MNSNDVNKHFSDVLFEHEISTGFAVSYKIRNGTQAKTAEAASAFGIGQDIIKCYSSMGGLNYTWKQSKIALDFPAYLELALAARGFFYWQTYLLELLYDIESVESERFKQFMPVLFEGFKLDEFKQRFNALKLIAR